MDLKREDIQRLAGALEEMLRQNNTRLAASRLFRLREKNFPEEFAFIREDLKKYSPQLRKMHLEIACFERLGIRTAFSKPEAGGEIPARLTLGRPGALLRLSRLYRNHTLHLEINLEDENTASLAYLKQQT